MNHNIENTHKHYHGDSHDYDGAIIAIITMMGEKFVLSNLKLEKLTQWWKILVNAQQFLTTFLKLSFT